MRKIEEGKSSLGMLLRINCLAIVGLAMLRMGSENKSILILIPLRRSTIRMLLGLIRIYRRTNQVNLVYLIVSSRLILNSYFSQLKSKISNLLSKKQKEARKKQSN